MTNLSIDGEDILDPEEFKGIEKAFNDIDIALRENAHDMRDFEDIIDDLASKWNDLSEVEKNSIALQAAGVRQKSVFLNIMETTARQAELYNEALNGTGATMEANEIYADSLQGKLNTLGTEWSNLAQNLVSADVFKAGIDVLTGFIKVLDTLNPLISILANTAIPALIAVFGLGLVSAINKSVVSMGYAGAGLKQMLLDFTGLNLIAKTSQTGFLGLKLSLDGVTTSALSATTAISALRLAISTVSIVLAVLPLAVTIFNKISDSIKKTKKSTEELIEATAELNSKYKENADAILESETNLKQIQRLQELIAEGNGDPLNNLDTDQLSEYKSIVDELEQLYPSLTQGWNSYANISKEDLDILIEKERTLLQAKRDTQKLEVEAGLAEMQSAQASKEKIMQEIAEAEKREAELLAKKEDLERQIAEKKAQGESTAPVGGGFSDQSIGYMYNQSLDEQLQSTNRALEINKQKLIENQNEVIKLNTETESYVDTINSLKNKGIDININTGQFKDMSVLVEELGTQFGKVKDDAEDFAKATEANIKNHVADRLAELPNLIQDAANAFSDSMSAVDNVVRAQEELAETGQLSISTLQSMAEKYPEILMYMGDKNAMKEYLLQLYDLEAQSMQNELDNYLMLRDEETIIDAQTFQAKVANNENYIALVASMNDFLAKNGLQTYDADAKNFESLIQAKTELLNHFMNQLAQANQAVASEAAELGIKDAITNFKVTSISMPKLNFGSGSKKTSSSSGKRPSSSSSSSSSTKKEVEDMELAIDIFYKFNKAIKDVEFSLSKLDKRLEYATGKERVEIMKEQIELYQKLHDEQQKLLSAQELEYARMVKTLAGEGFKIDSTGTITNYVEKLQELEKWANKATGTEKEARIEKVNQIKSWVDDFTSLVDDMNDTKLDLEDLGGNIKNAQEQLKSYYEDLLGKVESVESQITDMLKKEIEKRKQAMQEEYDKKLELLQKAKDAYNRQNEEDDYQSEYDKEKQKLIEMQQAINIAMKDTSLAGKKNLADLQKAYEEQKQKLEDMQKEHDRELQNQWFDDEMAKIEEEKAKAEEEFDKEFDEKAIAGMVAELIGNGFTKIGEDLIDLSQLMEEHFEGTFSMLGDKLKSDFLDTLKEAREVAVSINDIFKEIGVNADLSRVNDGVYGTSKASSRVVSEISKSTAMALNDGIATYLAKGIARTPVEGNNGVSIGSLLNVAGSIDRDTFPSVEKLVNQAVEKMQGMMKSNFRIGTGRI